MSQNIFHKVIKNENQISQLLVNLFNKNLEIRELVTKFLFNQPSEKHFKVKSFDNQKRDEDGQPDIQFKIEDNNEEIIGDAIIEVKTQDSQLTNKQPENYVKKLLRIGDQSKKKVLFFLIPHHYQHEKEIKDRFLAIKEKGTVELKICHWNKLIAELIDKKYATESDLLVEILAHINDKFGYTNIKFTPPQIDLMKTIEVPKTLIELKNLIDSVAKNLNPREIKWYNGIDEGGGSYGLGYGFHYKDYSMWFGYDFELWNNDTIGNPVLLIYVNRNSRSFNLFDTHFKGRVKEIDTNSKYVDITEKIAAQNNVEQICEMIVDFTNLLNDIQ